MRPDCHQSATSTHRCSTCGCYPVLVYIAAADTGFYCPRCCPASPREAQTACCACKASEGEVKSCLSFQCCFTRSHQT